MEIPAIEQGERDGYLWLWAPDGRLWDLLNAVPELVLGRVVAVASFDSGPFQPTADELAMGWQRQGDIAFSPLVRSVSELPRAEWDEWYVLRQRRDLPRLEVFVNYSSFTPKDNCCVGDLDSTWDRAAAQEVVDHSNATAERFWRQLRSLKPEVYIAEGQALTCVAKDRALFHRAYWALRGTTR